MREGLKPCPFCGIIPGIAICDDEGNNRDEDYEQDPYSGLGFRISHEVENTNDCPIAAYTGETLGTFIYETREEAITAWNNRAPAPMTSVVTWVRYTGEPETLPEEDRTVILKTQKLVTVGDRSLASWFVVGNTFTSNPVELPCLIDDLWSYLPTPPEANA